mgnify:CR=1 FL=1
MAEPENNKPDDTGKDDDDGPIPAMQSIMDNPFLLLFTIWGVMEIAAIPLAK